VTAPEHLVVGHVSKAHGTRGEVYVWPLTDHPDEVFAEDRELVLGDEDGEAGPDPEWVTVESVRPYKRGLLVKLREFADRTAVEPIVGRYLLAPISELPPLEEGEVYYHQLLGLEVVTVEGEVVGRVREVYETAPAHLLEVKGKDRLHLIPFTEEIVERIELGAGRLVIRPPAGLLEI